MRWSETLNMFGNSQPVISTQTGPHKNLADIVRKHLETPFTKPPTHHATQALTQILLIEKKGTPLILDAGCGTGESTRRLATQHPEHFVIGVDKSLSRISRERTPPAPENMCLLQADLIDLYPLMAKQEIKFDKHYHLYPNPWPKPAHLQRRWHGSPVFPSILKLGGALELRTNWQIYAEEFCEALALAGHAPTFSVHIPADDHLTLFEKKYDESGHTLFRLHATLTGA